MAGDWTAVIPVKPLDGAKSRLRGAVPDGQHAELALALVRDTVAAVLACPAVGDVLVVTDDPDAAQAALKALGRQALHAAVLGFEHPISGEAMHFESKPPEDLANLIEALQ